MAEELEDPREVPWHPRNATHIVGHRLAVDHFNKAFASGRPHHAWLMMGPSGIGKATLAYKLAEQILATAGKPDQARRWITSRAHPDLAVLERGFNDSKPRKLRAEISVDEARAFIDFFNRTSGSGGWRVGLVDCADDLTSEAANALLKLIEEPPSKALILIVCHVPGRILRTLRSRCMRLPLNALSPDDNLSVLNNLPLEPKPNTGELQSAAGISGGRPGHALQLLNSEGAKAFSRFIKLPRNDAASRVAIGNHFASRAAAVHDFDVFMSLLLEWLADKAAKTRQNSLAELYSQLMQEASITDGYNLDRRTAVIQALAKVEDALKAA